MVNDAPPPGYYEDPGGVARYRWWTGTAWSEQTADVLPAVSTDASSALPAPPAPPAPASPGPGLGGRVFAIVGGAWTVFCWMLIVGYQGGGPSQLGLVGLVPIVVVWRLRYRRRRSSVLREGLGRLGEDSRAHMEWMDGSVHRMVTRYHPSDPHWVRKKETFTASWVLLRLAMGALWLVLCATWFPIRDAVASLRPSAST